jgi:hypothetical protein
MAEPFDPKLIDQLAEVCFKRGVKRLQLDQLGIVIEMGVTLNPNFPEDDMPLPRSAREGSLDAPDGPQRPRMPGPPPSSEGAWVDALPDGVPVLHRRDGGMR